MAKETQKEKIERLEQKVIELNQIIADKINVINAMQEKANDLFANSTDKKQLEQKTFMLEKLLESAEHRRELAEAKAAKRDEYIQKLKNEQQQSKHNERGAGRKVKFSIAEREMMKMYRTQGKTIKTIAEMYGCSVGSVHKIINEN